MADALDELVGLAERAESSVVPFAAKGKIVPKPEVGVELGVASGMPFLSYQEYVQGAGYVAPNTSALTVDQLVEMRQKDGTARALMRLLTLPIRSTLKEAEWVEPEGASAPKETEFANLMFQTPPSGGGMETTFSKVMAQVLLAMTEGFAAFEQVRQVPEDGPLKGKITLKKLSHRDSRTVKFIVEDDGSYKGLRQLTSLNGKQIDVFIPAEKALYVAVNEEENPYYGVSMFESAWYHFDAKRKLYYIAHVAAQFAAVPGRIGKLPVAATNPDIVKFRSALSDFAFNTSMMVPFGFDVQPFNGSTGFDFLKLIDHHDMQMAKSVLAKFLGDESKPSLIDNTANDPNADFFVLQLEAIMNEIADTFTYHLMPSYIDWNFGSKVYPVFRFGVLSDATKDVIKELFQVVATAQSTQWTPEFIRELEKKLTDKLGLEVDYDEVDKREEKEKADQAQFQSQYFGGQPGGAPPDQGAAAPPDQGAAPPDQGAAPPDQGGFPPGA